MNYDWPCYVTNSAYLIPKALIPEYGRLTLRSRLSVLDFKSKVETPKAYFEIGDYILIPKIDKQVLESCIKTKLTFIPNYVDENKVEEGTYKLKLNPLPFQEPILNEAKKIFDYDEDKRVCVTLGPGNGKTYIASNIINHLKCKFLFIVYSGELVTQGLENLEKFLDAPGLFALTKSNDLFELRYDKINGLFMTHAMFRYLIKNYGWERITDILCNKIGITMKVLDEFDRETTFGYRLETHMMFRYSLYLTGTPFRSLKMDDRIFQAVYRKAHILGRDVVVPPNKAIIYINYRSTPAPNEYNLISRNEDTFKTYYNNFLGRKDVCLDYIMDKLYHSSDSSIMKRILDNDSQIVFFVGRIESCEIVKEKLIKNHGIDEDDIGIVNSSIKNKRIYEENKTKKFIVSTCASLGRGYDSKNIQMLVFLEFHYSKSETIQSISRVGRVGGKFGYVVYPIDHSFINVVRAFESKVNDGIFAEAFKTAYTLPDIPPEYYSKYYYGYRADSERAKEIAKYMDKKKKQMKFRDKIKYA